MGWLRRRRERKDAEWAEMRKGWDGVDAHIQGTFATLAEQVQMMDKVFMGSVVDKLKSRPCMTDEERESIKPCGLWGAYVEVDPRRYPDFTLPEYERNTGRQLVFKMHVKDFRIGRSKEGCDKMFATCEVTEPPSLGYPPITELTFEMIMPRRQYVFVADVVYAGGIGLVDSMELSGDLYGPPPLKPMPRHDWDAQYFQTHRENSFALPQSKSLPGEVKLTWDELTRQTRKKIADLDTMKKLRGGII